LLKSERVAKILKTPRKNRDYFLQGAVIFNRLFFYRALMLWTLLALASCRETILNELNEAQANQVWLALSKKEISATKRKSGVSWNILVDENEAVKALQILQDYKLPRGVWSQEIEEGSSLIATKEERLIIRERHLAKSLEASLLSLPGIDDAHVHISLLASDERSKSSASALVVSENSTVVQPQQLRELISGATGIQLEYISIALVDAKPAGI
jgi:type III secretory pathway lipoprotein EscJ